MNAKFKQGDQVTVNGQEATILSWPENNIGIFGYRFTAGDLLNYSTGTAGFSREDKAFEPVGKVDEVILVKAAGEITSTLGDISAFITETDEKDNDGQ